MSTLHYLPYFAYLTFCHSRISIRIDNVKRVSTLTQHGLRMGGPQTNDEEDHEETRCAAHNRNIHLRTHSLSLSFLALSLSQHSKLLQLFAISARNVFLFLYIYGLYIRVCVCVCICTLGQIFTNVFSLFAPSTCVSQTFAFLHDGLFTKNYSWNLSSNSHNQRENIQCKKVKGRGEKGQKEDDSHSIPNRNE